MSFVSDETGSYLTESGMKSLNSIFLDDVVMTRSYSDSIHGWLVNKRLFTYDTILNKKGSPSVHNISEIYDYIVDMCIVNKRSMGPNGVHAVNAIFLIHNGHLAEVTTKGEVYRISSNMIAICSSSEIIAMLDRNMRLHCCNLMKASHERYPILGGDDEAINRGVFGFGANEFVGMSVHRYSGVRPYTVCVWSSEVLFRQSFDCDHDYPLSNLVRVALESGIKYAESSTEGILVLTNRGSILRRVGDDARFRRVNNTEYVSVITPRSDKLKWLAVKIDGTHDIVSLENVTTPGVNYDIILTNTDPMVRRRIESSWH